MSRILGIRGILQPAYNIKSTKIMKYTKYSAYITTENGEGYVQKIWEGDNFDDFVIYTDIFKAGCKITIDENYEKEY